MPEFKIVHVSDGATVAESIAKKFTGDKYNLLVELFDLRRRSSTIMAPSLQTSTSAEAPDSRPGISVLLVTPAMMKYLSGVTDEERSYLTTLMMSNQAPVTLSCFVSQILVKDQIKLTFKDSDLKWHYLEVGESRESFHQCIIELISMMEESHGEMPVPTLKKYHLLPNRSVLARDTMYILTEKQLVDSCDDHPLSVMLKSGTKIAANQIADCLFQFEVPECQESAVTIEVFTNSGESIGSDVIKYRDKLQVLADILYDILSPIEFMYQAMHVSKLPSEEMDSVMNDWLKSGDKKSVTYELQKLVDQWVESIKSVKILPTRQHQELPALLYLLAKYCLHTLSKTLQADAKLSEAVVSDSDGTEFDKSETAYQNERLPKNVTAEKEKDKSVSCYEEDELYVSPDYCTPDEFVQSGCSDGIIYLDMNSDQKYQSEISTASLYLPRTTKNSWVKSPLSKSCPPVYISGRHSPPCYDEPHYVNTAQHHVSEKQQEICATNSRIHTNHNNSGQPRKIPCQVMRKATSFSGIPNKNCLSSSLTCTSFERLTQEAEHSIHPRGVRPETSSANSARSKSRSFMNSIGRHAITPRPSQPVNSFLPNTNEHSEFETLMQKIKKDENNKSPELPPRPGNDGSKPAVVSKPKSHRRLSLCSEGQVSTSCLLNAQSSSLSLTKLNEVKTNLHGKVKLTYSPTSEHFRFPENAAAPTVPYSCRPSPPLPRANGAHQHLKRTISDSCTLSVTTRARVDPVFGQKLRKSVGVVEYNSYQDIAPDYSQPVNLHFEDFHTGSNVHDCLKSDYSLKQEESIYVEVDEEWKSVKSTGLVTSNSTNDLLRKSKLNSKTSTSSPSSLPNSSGTNQAQKLSPQSSSAWPSLSYKLSLRSVRASRDHTTKM